MNKIVLENTRDVPLTTDLLAFMQASYSALEKLAAIGGDNFIVSGCTVSGSTVASGWMVLKGKLVPFTGGSIQTNVRIITTENVYPVGAGSETEIVYTAEFGTSANAEDNVAWSSITRGKVNSNIDRLDALENLEWVQLTAPSSSGYTIDTSNAFITKTPSGEVKMKGYITVATEGSVSAIFSLFTVPPDYLPEREVLFSMKTTADGLGGSHHVGFISNTISNVAFSSFNGTIYLDGVSYFPQ